MKIKNSLYFLSFIALLGCSPEPKQAQKDYSLARKISKENKREVERLSELIHTTENPFFGFRGAALVFEDYNTKLFQSIGKKQLDSSFFRKKIDLIKSKAYPIEDNTIIDSLVYLLTENVKKPEIEFVLVNEAKAINLYYHELLKNYKIFNITEPVISGFKELKIGETDTLTFDLACSSNTLINLVFLGDPEELMKSTENHKPIKTSYKDNYKSKLIIKGKHKVTGVINFLNLGGQTSIPFEYEYEVK